MIQSTFLTGISLLFDWYISTFEWYIVSLILFDFLLQIVLEFVYAGGLGLQWLPCTPDFGHHCCHPVYLPYPVVDVCLVLVNVTLNHRDILDDLPRLLRHHLDFLHQFALLPHV